MKKYTYMFNEGNASMKELLGGKGANLAEMTGLGLPVPQGFTVTTEACTKYYDDGRVIAPEIENEIFASLEKIEKQYGKKLGDKNDPLLVSVRSGSRASMPGMMDTILNLGLNDNAVEALAKKTGNPRFAYDSYRRFIQMFSDVVMGQSKEVYEHILKNYKKSKGCKFDVDLTAQHLSEIIKKFKDNYKKAMGAEFPQDPKVQLMEAVKAVFRSWDNPRAEFYRRMNGIPYNWGTAVNVQAMVFGNKGDTSGTGVAFTRNPNTGEKELFGDYLMNAQGEDVVAGIRTPNHISQLKAQNPEIYAQFESIVKTLETRYRDMQDIEFTIEEGKLYMLQTRNGKRTGPAAFKIAVDLVKEGVLNEKEALLMLDPKQLDSVLHPVFDEKELKAHTEIAKGVAASPGAAVGKIVFSSKKAVELKQANPKEKMILVRPETNAEDISGMDACEGFLTMVGGAASHAAVVARGMGKCCVCGCQDITSLDEKKGEVVIGTVKLKEGDYLSLNGTTGKVYQGQIRTVLGDDNEYYLTIMKWADKYRALKVRTNSDTPKDTTVAVGFGAEGIGLTRSEHMFFAPERILVMREMIVSATREQREAALNKLLPMQKEDYKGIYKALKGMPATIRFLDPPFHEFVPHTDAEIRVLAKDLNKPFPKLKAAIEKLHESNPMMGHRGCRLCITYPEIAVMQTRAVIEAAIEVTRENGLKIVPEIMIPLTCEVKEFKVIKDIVKETADAIIANSGVKLEYLIGTMIEIPRAALLADEIAAEAEFFSFGTNDLTQMTFGFSRDDAGKFLNDYYDRKLLDADPFARIDEKGVGMLIKMAVEKGRGVRPSLKVGICGEHGGDPATVEFCHRIGLDYVSCSPFRVPIARLAAAQANLKFPR